MIFSSIEIIVRKINMYLILTLAYFKKTPFNKVKSLIY